MDEEYQVLYEYQVSKNSEHIAKYSYGGDIEYNKEAILAILLMEQVAFLNSHWWMGKKRTESPFYNTEPDNPWSEDACKTFSVNIDCSDIFAWGCSDAEECYYEDLIDIFEYWLKDKEWGAAIWCIKKRNLLPQKPVYDRIMKAGIWNLDEMNLEKNDW